MLTKNWNEFDELHFFVCGSSQSFVEFDDENICPQCGSSFKIIEDGSIVGHVPTKLILDTLNEMWEIKEE
jgi:hypothetical protein